jgi:hypothetical protein
MEFKSLIALVQFFALFRRLGILDFRCLYFLITQLLIEDLVEDIEGSEMNVGERITQLLNNCLTNNCFADYFC